MSLDRVSQLSPAELSFYQAVLRAFAEQAGPPEPAWLTATAAARGLDAGTILRRFSELDLLVLDSAGAALASMYPFSAVPTRHLVRFADGRHVYALCAIDALGIPFMLDQDVAIESADPTTDEPIRVQIQQGVVSWQPETAVVLTVALEQPDAIPGAKAESCCPAMNFFADEATAEAYRRTHCELPGLLLSQEEAVQRGKRAFGDVLASTAGA